MPEVILPGASGRIEGRYSPGKRPNAPIALILHPHPKANGHMNNPVTVTLYQLFVKRGFATLRYIGRQNEDDLGLLALDDALTLDAGLSWRFSDAVSIEARGENLFDELVPAAISSSGIVERATPRTLWIGARLSF